MAGRHGSRRARRGRTVTCVPGAYCTDGLTSVPSGATISLACSSPERPSSSSMNAPYSATRVTWRPRLSAA